MTADDLFDPDHTYYSNPALKGLIQQLHHLAFFGDGISLVQGNKGSGKTKLIQELQAQFADANEFSVVSMDSKHELGESIKLIALQLGLLKQENLSVGELLSQLRHYSHSLLQDKKLCVVCVDNAHNLDEQSIGALLSLLQGKGDDNYGLHLILFAVPGLEKRIDALQIIDVPVYDFSMPEFSVAELTEFIQQQIHTDEIDKAKIQQIWSITKGNPGKALELYHAKDHRQKSLANNKDGLSDVERPDENERSSQAFSIPVGHVAAMTVLGGILIWSIIYSNSVEIPKPKAIVSNIELDGEKTKQTDSVADKEKSTTQPSAALKYDENVTGNITRHDIDLNDDLILMDRNSKRVDDFAGEKDPASDVKNTQQNITAIEAPKIDVKKAIEKELKKTIEQKKSGDQSEEDVNLKDTENLAPLISLSPNTPNKSKTDVSRVPTKEEAFLIAQPSDVYTLQVLAASKLISLQTYIEKQSNRENLYMYRGTREGKSWYVVVANIYKTRQAALDARSTLPKEQAKAGPWPRKLSAVQQEINEYLNHH